MVIIDISWPISTATTGYKDAKVVDFKKVKDFDKDGVRETDICLSSHTGTHIDAPSHFLRDGLTIDQITLDRLMGPCKVFDLITVQEHITEVDLKEKDKQLPIEEDDIILLKTFNSAQSATEKFSPHFVALDLSAAEFLAKKKVKAVGIDYLGIEKSNEKHIVHRELMHHDIVIIEGLRLQRVAQGTYFCCCLPLLTIGLEAAPARAVLIEQK